MSDGASRPRPAPRSSLPPGDHDYGDLLQQIARGEYDFAWVITASGREVPLIGVSREQLAALVGLARDLRCGLALMGSRVVGPRSWQRRLAPALRWTPLTDSKRSASVGLPEIGVPLEKRFIKERGRDSPHTSDLSVVLLDGDRRGREAVVECARSIERRANALGLSFEVRVFAELSGRTFATEREFLEFAAEWLLRDEVSAHGAFADEELVQAIAMTCAFVR